MSCKRKKVLTIITSIVLVVTIITIYSIRLYLQKNDIDYILKTEYYSYLPEEAQDYIREVYEQTNEVILTEKNKEAKKYYLNPKYIEYLTLTEEEKKETELIPNEMIVDYVYNASTEQINSEEIPSSFNLGQVNGKNYVSKIKDQGGLGLCWAFATNGQAESLLLIQNDKSYSTDSQLFSERQIDYATADDGIIDSKPLYDFNRILGDGGNFEYSSSVMMDSFGLVDDSWAVYDDTDYSPKEKSDVYNFNNSLYEVNKTVYYPYLDLSSLSPNNSSDQQIRENYLNNLKSLIMNYGGAYLGTGDPIGYCSVLINGKRFIYDDGDCASAGHAMQVIGWDDNISYSLCTGTVNQSGYYHINKNTSSCSGKVVTGKGAWILKNSWGSDYQYVYVAYDSKYLDFNLITELGHKDWDNYYSLNTNIYRFNYRTTTKSYERTSKDSEKLVKIKFGAGTQDEKYNVYVATDSKKNYVLYKTITVDFPGLYTVDLSDEDINLNDTYFYVKVTSESGYVSSDISAYTDNVEKNYQLTAEDAVYENSLTNIDKYVVRVSADTVNILENELIDYKILNQNREEITSNYTYEENNVFANKVFSRIIIDNDLVKGKYILQSIYKGQVLDESNLTIESDIITIEGEGTEENPYVITTPAQLNLIRKNAFAFYELGNDIDLTYDTTNKNGLFYNDGKGWEPIKYSNLTIYSDSIYASEGFTGGFNGNNHKIIGLNINRPTESSIGLFANTYNQNFSNLHIKNFVLENPNIVGNNFVGGVVGYIDGTTYERKTELSNIAIVGGKISGNNYVGGVVGLLRAGSYLTDYYTGVERHLIDSLYNATTIEANDYAGGLFGYVTNITGYNPGNSVYKISNVLNKGTVISNNTAGGIAGSIKTRENNYITIYDSMNTGKVLGSSCSGGITCKLATGSVGNLNLNNIFYVDSMGITNSSSYIKLNNVSKKSVSELMNSSSYNSWTSYKTYWKQETIDSKLRLPVLRFMNFNYTEMTDITISIGKKVNIFDYLKPELEAAKNLQFEIQNDKIATINSAGEIEAKSIGNTTIHVLSNYDGYEDDIVLTVNALGKITYYSNYGDNDYTTQDIEINSFKLNKNPFVRSNYTFKGWNTKADGTGESYTDEQEVNLTGDIILYAQWTPEQLTVTFNSNNGTSSAITQTFEFDVKEKLQKNDFTKTGYTFAGWNTKSDGSGTAYMDEQELSLKEDITLYARWTPNKYTVEFNVNGGTGYMVNQEFNYDTEANLSKNIFTRTGYTFTGWNTKSDGSGTTFIDELSVKNLTSKNNEVITLYANWTPNKYTIKFNANGGTGSMVNQLFNYDESKRLLKNDYIKNNYTFIGWNTKSDGTGTMYVDEENIKNLSSNNNEIIILYAIWEESYSYIINKYSYDEFKKIIEGIEINTTVANYNKNFKLNTGYSMDVSYKTINKINYLYTGAKTKIYKGNNLFIEYTNIIRGEVTGDAKINYLDYVAVYNHIQKVKHPELSKTKLKNEYLIAADMSGEGLISYLDYVMIYNKIKELKGGK